MIRKTSEDFPVPFGYKMGWLSIRSSDVLVVVNALSLSNPRESTWKRGIETAYEKDSYIFATPSVNGWVLAVGWLFMKTDAAKTLITKLSRQFGEAQAFATHRVIEYHHWMLARKGIVQRVFSYLGDRGEILSNEGEPTAVEQSFRWEALEKLEWLPDEADVMNVAGGWSITPTTLGPEVPYIGKRIFGIVPRGSSIYFYKKGIIVSLIDSLSRKI